MMMSEKQRDFFQDMTEVPRALMRDGMAGFWNKMNMYYVLKKWPLFVLTNPRVIELEISRDCNLKCAMCGRFKHKFPRAGIRGQMGPDLFAQILDRLSAVQDIYFRGAGEPFLNPHLFDLVRIAKERHIAVRTYTNGTLLDAKLGQETIESGMAEITVSFDAGTKATYEKIRNGASFETVTQNMKAFTRLKATRGTKYPALCVLFIAMRENISEVAEAVELFKSLGVEKVTIKNLDSTVDKTMESQVLTAPEYRSLMDLRRKWEGKGISVVVPERSRLHDPILSMACWRAWMCPFISSEGNVSACPGSYYFNDLCFGNLLEASFRRIWNGKEARKLRKSIKENRSHICQSCPEC